MTLELHVEDLISLERFQWLWKLKFAYNEPPQDIRYPLKLYRFVLQNFISDSEWFKVWSDMFAPTIRMKFDAEIENVKAINKVSSFNLK